MKISIASMGDEPGARFLQRAQLAELLGFDGFFHNDKKWARDLFVRLGAATQVTSQINLGMSVVDPYTRHAALLAQATATLAELAPGRVRVVLGAGSHFENLPGYGNRKPVVGLREASDLIRRLWNGEKVSVDGEIVKFKDGVLDWKPTAVPRLYIASRGPQILKLAGEVADGVLIGSFATPPGIEYAKQFILPGLDASGRRWQDIKLASWIYVCVLENETDTIPDAVKRGVSFAFWSSRDVLTDMADQLAPDMTDEFRKFLRETPNDWSPAVMAELRRLIPRGMLDSLAVVGTAPQVVARLQALETAGIQEAVIWPFPMQGQSVEDQMIRLAKDVIPQLSVASDTAA
jgi:5,10-methylenetetrahydromethanopterin reductase